MYNFKYYSYENVLKIFNDDIIFDFEKTINKIINFFDFIHKDEILKKCEILKIENFVKKNEKHVTNLNLQKERYKKYWNNRIQIKFDEIFPEDLLTKLKFLK